ncbi:MAG TPA: ATP-binding cassette domain-containing protein, partial [Nitrososphaeraceae archaeon]
MLDHNSRRENKAIVNNQPSTNPAIALKVEKLSKVFESAAGKVFALKQVNFTINKGEFVSIIGPSGSGKSTLLNMIGALDRPTFGKVFIG